jgi:hypothetical protein
MSTGGLFKTRYGRMRDVPGIVALICWRWREGSGNATGDVWCAAARNEEADTATVLWRLWTRNVPKEKSEP